MNRIVWMLPRVCLLLFVPSCATTESNTLPLFSLLEDTGINFSNDVKDSKDDNSFLFRNFYNGGGVALGDLDNDGFADVFLTSNQAENKLYLNKGGLRFEDISRSAGLQQDSMWSTGVSMADVNADGWLDIYVCSSGNMQSGNRRNKLYINNQDLTFSESAATFGLDISGYCTQASFLDYDLDGDLDCFIINNSPIPFSSLSYAGMRDVEISKWNVDEKLKGGGNHLYQNTGGHFSEVTAVAGLHTGLISFGLGVSVGDINGDDYPDIYVGNDFIEKDYLYVNQKDGTFRDELEERLQQISMSSMSSDLGDINNDGFPEIFTTDMIPDNDYRLKTTGTFDNIDLYLSKQKAGLYNQYVRNSLQLNNGGKTFSEIANYSGVHGTDWSWGSVFLDADNDGLTDIFVCSGIAKDVGDLDFLDFFSGEVYTKMMATGQHADMDELLKHIPATPLPNRVFQNKGDLRFEDVGHQWGFDKKAFSNSVAYADLDNDGDLDLVINNENSPAAVYQNNSKRNNKNNSITVQLKGDKQNPFAIGSKIKVYKGRTVFYRELSPSRGFQSSVDHKLLIGVGTTKAVDSLVITWPDHSRTSYTNPSLNQLHVLTKPPARGKQFQETPPAAGAVFTDLSGMFNKHQEDEYVDFYYERNLPQMLSRGGPRIATGDVNADGLEDIYIGGGRGQLRLLYLQTPQGRFIKKTEQAFAAYQDFEDAALLFFDADGDKDLDLFIGAGGNRSGVGSREMQHRLFFNDGKGNFTINTLSFPNNDMNIGAAAAHDYDTDGDVDLFIGGRSVPYAYGVSAQSVLYENNGSGIFKDVTPSVNKYLHTIGMVTSALWADVAGDKTKELIVSGEWMTTRIFTVSNKTLMELPRTGLENLHGWWQSLTTADVNNDGALDLVIGNIGENFYLKPGPTKPAKLWIADYDNNGERESFLTQTVGRKDMPVFLKREVTDQFPGLKKDNLKHSVYATKSIHELFEGQFLKKAEVKLFNYASSIVAINNGKGNFNVQRLPTRLQLSSVNAISAADFNGDGFTDLITGGNLFTFPPQFGRLDGSYGDLLLNNKKGGFSWVNNSTSGFNWRGEVKDIKLISIGKKQHILITQNNIVPVLLQGGAVK